MIDELNNAQMNALRSLYNEPSGLPFRELGVDNRDFVSMVRARLVNELEGTLIDIPNSDTMVVHAGLVLITPIGKACVEQELKRIQAEKKRLAEREEDQAERRKEKWRDRLWGFFFGVLTGVTVTLLLKYIQPLLDKLVGQ